MISNNVLRMYYYQRRCTLLLKLGGQPFLTLVCMYVLGLCAMHMYLGSPRLQTICTSAFEGLLTRSNKHMNYLSAREFMLSNIVQLAAVSVESSAARNRFETPIKSKRRCGAARLTMWARL